MTPADRSRLDGVLAVLPPADAHWLSGLVEPPAFARKRRLDARDAGVCAAMALLAGLGPLLAARALHAAWCRAARGVGDHDATLHELACAIHAAHDGAPLSVSQILRIAREGRTPPVA